METVLKLETMMGGAFGERFEKCLAEVARDLDNPNKVESADRAISATVTFKPGDGTGLMIVLKMDAKLAPTKPAKSTGFLSHNKGLRILEIEAERAEGRQVSIGNFTGGEE